MARTQFRKFYSLLETPLDHLAYYERPYGKWPRVQRWCSKLLRYLGAYTREKGVTRFELDYDNLLDVIARQANGLRRLIAGDLAYIVVGPHEAREIARGIPEYELTSVVLDDRHTRLRAFGMTYRGVLFGMRLIVVPWFDGVLLLPRLEE